MSVAVGGQDILSLTGHELHTTVKGKFFWDTKCTQNFMKNFNKPKGASKGSTHPTNVQPPCEPVKSHQAGHVSQLEKIRTDLLEGEVQLWWHMRWPVGLRRAMT